jgi:hypothetical protein
MTTEDRIFLLNKFITHIDKKTADKKSNKNPF